MCDTGPLNFRSDKKCFFCGKGPAASINEDFEEEPYCRPCAVETYGEQLVEEMEDSGG